MAFKTNEKIIFATKIILTAVEKATAKEIASILNESKTMGDGVNSRKISKILKGYHETSKGSLFEKDNENFWQFKKYERWN